MNEIAVSQRFTGKFWRKKRISETFNFAPSTFFITIQPRLYSLGPDKHEIY